MSKVTSLTKSLYLMMLASLGMLATWFAMMSANSCWFAFTYQPKMPASLIKKD